MKRGLGLILVGCLVLGLSVAGCAKKAASADEAIQNAKTMESVEAQVNYLVSQANAFVNSKQFEEGIQAAKYVLANLDKNSEEAKSIVEKATAEMKKAAQGMADDMKNKLGNLGK